MPPAPALRLGLQTILIRGVALALRTGSNHPSRSRFRLGLALVSRPRGNSVAGDTRSLPLPYHSRVMQLRNPEDTGRQRRTRRTVGSCAGGTTRIRQVMTEDGIGVVRDEAAIGASPARRGPDRSRRCGSSSCAGVGTMAAARPTMTIVCDNGPVDVLTASA